MSNGLEYKALRLDLKSDGIDEKTGEFEGYVSVFGNVDHDGDIIDAGAFAKTIGDNGGRFPGLWQHDVFEPIGVSRAMLEDDNGLKVDGVLAMGTQRGREAYELLSMGALKGFSIGYRPIKHERDIDKGVRRLKEIRLYEWSAVTFPANELAVVTGMKASRVLAMASDILESDDGRLASASKSKIESAIEALSALLDEGQPGKSTDPSDEAATSSGEPSDESKLVDTLREFTQAFTSTISRRGDS